MLNIFNEAAEFNSTMALELTRKRSGFVLFQILVKCGAAEASIAAAFAALLLKLSATIVNALFRPTKSFTMGRKAFCSEFVLKPRAIALASPRSQIITKIEQNFIILWVYSNNWTFVQHKWKMYKQTFSSFLFTKSYLCTQYWRTCLAIKRSRSFYMSYFVFESFIIKENETRFLNLVEQKYFS